MRSERSVRETVNVKGREGGSKGGGGGGGGERETERDGKESKFLSRSIFAMYNL